MSLDQATDLLRETLLLSLIQAVTQIQEQTLTFVPKIAAMVAAAVFLMPWIGHRLLDYAGAMFGGGF